jgi:hypothetical protein
MDELAREFAETHDPEEKQVMAGFMLGHFQTLKAGSTRINH